MNWSYAGSGVWVGRSDRKKPGAFTVIMTANGGFQTGADRTDMVADGTEFPVVKSLAIAKDWCEERESRLPVQVSLPGEAGDPARRATVVCLALDVIRSRMAADADFAWTWHCNVAACAFDLVPNDKANLIASRFMKAAFGVDTSKGNPPDAKVKA